MKKQTKQTEDKDSELEILGEIVARLEELETSELERVMAYLNSRYAPTKGTP